MEGWQDTGIKTVIGLVGAGVGGIVTHLWQRRRTSSRELFLVLRGAFDRPAFKGQYLWHSDQKAFQEAIDITLKAVKTGRRFDRRGQELDRAEGRHRGTFAIRDPAQRKTLEEVEDRLQRINKLSKDMQGSAATSTDAAKIAETIDRDRDEVIRLLNLTWKSLGIEEMRLPTAVKVYEEVHDPQA
jgi:hypothetical protein